jgi:hypothetical protein
MDRASEMLIEAFECRILAHDLKGELINDPSATPAHIQVLPTSSGLYFVSVVVAGKETIRIGLIAA